MVLGYACINTILNNLTPKVSTNRILHLKALKEDKKTGYHSLAERILQNVTDLNTILEWNLANDIRLFRLSSDIFPHPTLYDIEELPSADLIKAQLKKAGDFALMHGMRLTLHPGPFNVLASPKPKVVNQAIAELNFASKFMDMMGLSRTHWNSINIHVWASYGDKTSALKRFCDNFHRLDQGVKDRLIVENDDRPTLYNIEDLISHVHTPLGVPICLDYHHFKFIETIHTLESALYSTNETWPKDIPQLVHYSEGVMSIEGEETKNHTYFINNQIPDFGIHNLYVMIEAKGKEQALINYRLKHWV